MRSTQLPRSFLVASLAATGLAGACGASAPPPASPPTNTHEIEPDGRGQWGCFVSPPDTPELEVGNVTHLKSRVLADRFELVNVNVVNGYRRVSSVVAHRAGDAYVLEEAGATFRFEMLDDAGTHHRLTASQDGKVWFTEETWTDATGMTLISTDAGDGDTTTHRYDRAPCDVVDRAIADAA